jgi:hypothetical protein
MSTEQCWSLQFDGKRCAALAAAPTHFCAAHAHRGGGANPLCLWRAPEAEMPPELVAALRRAAPDATFPRSEPQPPLNPASLSSAALPASPLPLVMAGAEPAVPPGAPASPEPSTSPPDPPCSSVSPCLAYPCQRVIAPDRTDWLLALLQDAMTGVMAGEATPLQKANAVSRLTALYLKAACVAEVEQANAALAKRAAAAEAYSADLEARATAWAEQQEAAPPTPQAPEREAEASASPGQSASRAERVPLLLVQTQPTWPDTPRASAPGDPSIGRSANGQPPEAVPTGRRAPP